MQSELREKDKRTKSLEDEVTFANSKLTRFKIEQENSKNASAHSIEVSLKKQIAELES